MIKSNQDTILLEQLLEKYRFVRPVPVSIQKSILASKKNTIVRVLKTVGVYSAVYGAFLSLYFSVKKIGIGGFFVKCAISGTVVASLTYGGYYAATIAARRATTGKAPVIPGLPSHKARNEYKWVDKITLYNGRVIMGAVISRGSVYEILTKHGIIHIPGNQIKMVNPVKIIEKENHLPDDSEPGDHHR